MDQDALEKFFLTLERAHFLDDRQKPLAYRDAPLAIGFGQTISQPSLVLDMTRLLAPEKDSRVLEIGTGSGYQTAFLAEFSDQVYTIERIKELSERAQTRLAALGYANIHFKVGDGSLGWPQAAPFDRIMVTAAAGKRPDLLIDQLAHSGRMVIPVGPSYLQELLLITKDDRGKIREQRAGSVRFVEMVGPYGWTDRDDSGKED